MELIFEFFERLSRKAPGSESTTRTALSLLPPLPANPKIVEFGCGSGVASLPLAQATGGHVTAIDIHQPFLDDLDRRAAAAGLADRIDTVCADMADLSFPAESFDLVWSEGAIYLIGFEEGLRRWRSLLRSGGMIAVSEVSWLCNAPPSEAADFWRAEYPAIDTVEANLAKIAAAGFENLAHFPLPAADWSNYFDPVHAELDRLLAGHGDDPAAREFAEGMRREIDIWNRFGGSYGYVFYLARS